MDTGQDKIEGFTLGQMNSMSSECTHLKQKYDRCFHNWFKSYLEASTGSLVGSEQYGKDSESRRARRTSLFTSSESDSQKLESLRARYETDCGALFAEYRNCIQVCFPPILLTYSMP